MHVNPRALIVSAVFMALLWLALTRGFGLVAIALDTLLGWGLWQLFPDDWLRSTPRNSRPT